MSPSPTPVHQVVTIEISRQLANHLIRHDLGWLFQETDVHFGKGPKGTDVVYRPELVYYDRDRFDGIPDRLVGVPDVVVEVVSPDSRRRDRLTKRDDYEWFGVREYWLIDPGKREMIFYRLRRGRYVQVKTDGRTFESQVIPGFKLDLRRVARLFPRSK